MTGLTGIPLIETERLRLRAPRDGDFAAWAEFFASPRARLERGPCDRQTAWLRWASDVALWVLRGYGPFGVEDRMSGAYVGEVGIYKGEGFPEPELGWFVVPGAEGRGLAFEAARAVLNWAAAAGFGWTRLVSFIDPANLRSIALALRLGGVRDDTLPGVDPGDVVIRHDLRGFA